MFGGVDTAHDGSEDSFGGFRRSVRGLTPDLVVADQRRRLAAALAVSLAERGYRDTAIRHVVSASGVSRRTVYALYENKDDLFRAAHAGALARFRTCRRSACAEAAGAPRPSSLEHPLTVLLGWAAADLCSALLVAAPVYIAGPHFDSCRRSLNRELVPFLPAAPWLREAAIDGLAELVAARILAGGGSSLPALAPALSCFLLSFSSGPQGIAS